MYAKIDLGKLRVSNDSGPYNGYVRVSNGGVNFKLYGSYLLRFAKQSF
jgi:hypothetical protein